MGQLQRREMCTGSLKLSSYINGFPSETLLSRPAQAAHGQVHAHLRSAMGSCGRSQAFGAGDGAGQKRALGCDAASPVSENCVPSLGQHLVSSRRSWIRAPAAESCSGKQREARKRSAWWKHGNLSFRKVAPNPKYEDQWEKKGTNPAL